MEGALKDGGDGMHEIAIETEPRFAWGKEVQIH